MFQRSLQEVLKRLSAFYPVLGITGPRQSGKTTLAKLLFTHLPYISLEDLDIRIRATQDPRGFLQEYAQGAIFDEVQHVPGLLSYLQSHVDEHTEKGRYVITGSQNFALSSHIAQSLSGRVGMTTLLPLSLEELSSTHPFEDISSSIFKGGYPALYQRSMRPLDFYPSYVQTYLEQDVRQIKNVGDLGRFQSFLKLCAGRVGQLVNLSSLAADIGLSHTTVRQWLQILEASYVIFFLQPHHNNLNKRIVKTPKLYFYDTGLACSLLGLEQASQLDTHYLKGNLFENLMVLELWKKRIHQGLPTNLFFWRDQTGHEVDLIAEWGGQIHAIEYKSGQTFQNEYVKNLHYFMNLMKDSPQRNIKAYLAYMGKQEGAYQGVELVNVSRLNQACGLIKCD